LSEPIDPQEGINVNTQSELRLDEVDLKLIDLLLSGHTTRQSAQILERPLSTIQRRARLLIQNGALKPTFELGYSRLRVKKGFLHVYLDDGNVSDAVDKLLARDGIYSVGAHIGNSDIVGFFVFQDSREVLDLIAWTKQMNGVERVVWSEEVYAMSTSPKLTKILGKNKREKTSKRVTTTTTKK
jgi:Lrp/AsnC family transcriptional regulator for asnA, asnC and gidA